MRVEMAFLRILPFLYCHQISMGTYFENLQDKNLDGRIKMCFTAKKVFLGETDFTATYLSTPKIKTFWAMLTGSG